MIDLLSTVLDDASKSVRVIGSFVFHAPVYRVTEHDTNTSSDICVVYACLCICAREMVMQMGGKRSHSPCVGKYAGYTDGAV